MKKQKKFIVGRRYKNVHTKKIFTVLHINNSGDGIIDFATMAILKPFSLLARDIRLLKEKPFMVGRRYRHAPDRAVYKVIKVHSNGAADGESSSPGIHWMDPLLLGTEYKLLKEKDTGPAWVVTGTGGPVNYLSITEHNMKPKGLRYDEIRGWVCD